MAKKSLQAMDDEDLEDSMSEDEVAAGSGEGGSESEEEQEWEPWLAPVVKDEAVTPARVTFYSQGDGKEMQDGWERVKVGHASNRTYKRFQHVSLPAAPVQHSRSCLIAPYSCQLTYH
jgi:hypothetical protein